MLAVIVLLVAVPSRARAEEMPAPADSNQATLVFGLTTTQLALAAAAGAAVGATAATVASGNVAGAGISTLAAIYIAHLFVEAVLVGGFYYFWPGEDSTDDESAPGMTIRGLNGDPPPSPSGLRLAHPLAARSLLP